MKKISYIFCLSLFFIFSAISAASANSLTAMNVPIPTVMYHKISDNPEEWNDYCISSAQLRSDFEELKKSGFTPITVNEYLDMADTYKRALTERNANAEVALREKLTKFPNPILITFDDGYKDGYSILFPMLKEYGFKANLSMVGSYEGNGDFLSKEQIKEMSDSGLVQFGNHTYALHDKMKNNLKNYYTFTQNYDIIKNDFVKNADLLREWTGKNDAFFTYPYGVSSDLTEKILDDMGVRVSLVTDLSAKFVKLSDSPRKISRLNRTLTESSSALVIKIINMKTRQSYSSAYNAMANYYSAGTVKNENPTVKAGNSIPIRFYSNGNVYEFTGNIENNTTYVALEELKKYGNISAKTASNNKIRINHFGVCDVVINSANVVTVSAQVRGQANLPVRAFFEFLGYTVNYDVVSKTVEIR